MRFGYDDGGRKAAGNQGSASDCVCRAIAIATEKPYQTVYDALNALGKRERRGKRKRGTSTAREGVYKSTTRRYISSLGWHWTPTMHIGSGCKVHLVEDELRSLDRVRVQAPDRRHRRRHPRHDRPATRDTLRG